MESLRLLSPGLLSLGPEQIQSPAFVIDKGALRHNLQILKDVQEVASCKILLALKGFAAWDLAPLIRQYLPGVAASSPHEARLGREEFDGEVHTYSPAFAPGHFAEVVEYSDHIIFNSIAQWQQHRPMTNSKAQALRCGLRINPEHSEVSTALYDPCAIGSRLGITESELEGQNLEGISGLHFHTLCELGADALERTLKVVEEKFGQYLHTMQWINLGGGHHITAHDYDTDLLISLIQGLQSKYQIEVILEPGEAIAIHTGVLIASVLDIVTNGNREIAILDTSAATHMPDILEMPYRPEIVGAGRPGKKEHNYLLGGVSCLAGDVIGQYSFEQPLQIGQRLFFLDMSHYSMVKTTNFNGVQLPSIATYEPANDTLKIVREFGYATYRDRLS